MTESYRGSVCQKLPLPPNLISVWMWDLFGCWKFCCEAHCPAVTNCHTGSGRAGLDGNNNQQLVRKTESGGLPLLLLLLLLSGKIHFTLLSFHSYFKSKEEGTEPILILGHSMGKLRLSNPLQCNAVVQCSAVQWCSAVEWFKISYFLVTDRAAWAGGLEVRRDVRRCQMLTIISPSVSQSKEHNVTTAPAPASLLSDLGTRQGKPIESHLYQKYIFSLGCYWWWYWWSNFSGSN